MGEQAKRMRRLGALFALLAVVGALAGNTESHSEAPPWYGAPGLMRRHALELANSLNLETEHRQRIASMRCHEHKSPLDDAVTLLSVGEKSGGLASMMKDKQLGAIIGEALKANPSSTKVDIQPIMKAITKLERKIRRERSKDSNHNKKTTKLCDKTDKELAGVMAKAEETQKQMNIREAQLRNLRRTAKISLHASISMERKIERILHAVRTEKRVSLEKYYVRRTKRRKDITVLHSAVSLVCTFKSFLDDQRCKDHKVMHAISN